MKLKKGIEYFVIIGALVAGMAGLISKWNKYTENINQLRKQNPAFAVVYDSLGTARGYLDDARYYAREENYEDALKELDKADSLLNKKKINKAILDSLVNNGNISTDDRKTVILLQAQIEGLRKEIFEALARKTKEKF